MVRFVSIESFRNFYVLRNFRNIIHKQNIWMYTYSRPTFQQLSPCKDFYNNPSFSPKKPNLQMKKIYSNPSPPESPHSQQYQKANNLPSSQLNKQKSPIKIIGKEPYPQTLHFRSTNQQKNRNPPKFLNNKAKEIKNGQLKKQMPFKQVIYKKNTEECQIPHSNYKSIDKTSPTGPFKHKIRKDSDPNIKNYKVLKNQSAFSYRTDQRNNPQDFLYEKYQLQKLIDHQKTVIKQQNQQIKKLQNELTKSKEQFNKRQIQIKTELEKNYYQQLQLKVQEIKNLNQKLEMQNQVFQNIEKQLMKKQGQLNSLISDYSSLLITKSQLKSQVTQLTCELTQLKQINSFPSSDTEEGRIKIFNLQKQLEKIIEQNKNKHQELTKSKRQAEEFKISYEKLCKFIQSINNDQMINKLLSLNAKYNQQDK